MFGGRSVEHDISIISGIQVYNALNKDKYNVFVMYITKENKMLIGPKLSKIETYKKDQVKKKTKEVTIINYKEKTYLKTKRHKYLVDIFIPVLHGEGMEDGTFCAYLDFLGCTYPTSNHQSSALSQNKVFTKDILKKYYISSPRYISVNKTNDLSSAVELIKEKLLLPLIIKPTNLGSSIGIEIVSKKEELKAKLKEAFKFGSSVIVEEFIKDKLEYNCACFKYNNHLYLSNIEEVKSSKEILTFEDKYLNKLKEESKARIISPKIDQDLETKIKETTKEIYQILNHQGIIRIDYIYDKTKNKLYFNEVNTIPGSFAFYLFDKEKLSFELILDMIIKESLLNKERQSKLVRTFTSSVLSKNNKILKK